MRHQPRAGALISALAFFFFSFFLSNCHTCRSEFTLDSLNFTRHDGNPILAPRGESWEAKDVFNPAAIVKDGKVCLLYRAEDRTGIGKWNGTSRIGLAVSDDGLHFQREPEPVLVPTEEYEKPGGCEDPRIVEHEGTYYVTYTAYDGEQARLCLASSKDLRRWTKHGVLFSDLSWSKSGAILAERIDGSYLMYFGDTHIWLARSNDLIHWNREPEPVLSPRPEKFDSRLVEPGPPPLLTCEGILLIYNSMSLTEGSYSAGAVLFDRKNPRRVLRRLDQPFFSPTQQDEIIGQVNQVVFLEGLVRFREKWFLYYGAADSRIGAATR